MKKADIKVLLVDDDVIERKSLKRELTLNRCEYHVVETSTAEEAFVYLDNMTFDVVIIDYHMPRISGIEAVIRLRNMPNLKHTAIVMVSNNSDEALMLECINAGAQDFLLKSEVTESQLTRTILQSRQRHELEQQLYESYQEVKNLAERDKLTGLHNRYYFDEALVQMLAHQKRHPDELTAVMLFDLDKFKHINDTFGHEMGDKLLVAVADRLLKALRGDTLFARFGGDEFVLACSQLRSIRHVKGLLKRLLKTFDTAFVVDEHELFCSCSVGVAIAPANGESSEELLKLADIAMYRAKRSPQLQYCFFEDNMQEAFLSKYKIESELRHAIEHDEFVLHYQPIIDMQSKRVAGAEALIRWPQALTSKNPGVFIPVAEESGLIQAIGKWVLQQAFRDLQKRLKEVDFTYVSVNVSPCQLCESGFFSYVESLIKQYEVPASALVFEVTETALLSEDTVTLNTLNSLHDLGIRIALDDFGTGFSSISHLLSCPIDIVKIDKSIIQNITCPNSKHKNMLEGLTYLLSQLNISIIAEGIETQEQSALCQRLGIKLTQGFLYYRPASEVELQLLLNNTIEQ
ncbi:GGDEF domain-containing response regulator [Pseudoalteromonas ardens]|uniref:two-component system response regulator n=1 Tax=Pseudoalteromonas ardens TaxID=3048490 RepID=UPI000676886C|nr:GGDEF domain-containing response regulator [Pseudoalteromonas sp. R96]MDK1313158.1 GGDEF domain-containing response regulator [Pseudoalteromonas sp. R96]